jgi:hypothetical protein
MIIAAVRTCTTSMWLPPPGVVELIVAFMIDPAEFAQRAGWCEDADDFAAACDWWRAMLLRLDNSCCSSHAHQYRLEAEGKLRLVSAQGMNAVRIPPLSYCKLGDYEYYDPRPDIDWHGANYDLIEELALDGNAIAQCFLGRKWLAVCLRRGVARAQVQVYGHADAILPLPQARLFVQFPCDPKQLSEQKKKRPLALRWEFEDLSLEFDEQSKTLSRSGLVDGLAQIRFLSVSHWPKTWGVSRHVGEPTVEEYALTKHSKVFVVREGGAAVCGSRGAAALLGREMDLLPYLDRWARCKRTKESCCCSRDKLDVLPADSVVDEQPTAASSPPQEVTIIQHMLNKRVWPNLSILVGHHQFRRTWIEHRSLSVDGIWLDFPTSTPKKVVVKAQFGAAVTLQFASLAGRSDPCLSIDPFLSIAILPGDLYLMCTSPSSPSSSSHDGRVTYRVVSAAAAAAGPSPAAACDAASAGTQPLPRPYLFFPRRSAACVQQLPPPYPFFPRAAAAAAAAIHYPTAAAAAAAAAAAMRPPTAATAVAAALPRAPK